MNERREYDDGYRDGWGIGYQDAMVDNQVIAFGAIRRAAEVARKAEADAHTLATQGSHDTAAFATSEALGIRRAIRAAIGSEKES